MPFELKIENNIIHVMLQGRVNSADLERLGDVVEKADAEHEAPPDRIIDFSSAEGIDLPSSALEALAERRRRASPKSHVKAAIVAPSALPYGLSRMYQTLAENPKINLQIFTDRDLALQWLSRGSAIGRIN